MKKVLLLVAAAFMAVTAANAQEGKFYVGTTGIGGNLMTGLWIGENSLSVGVAPEVGYMLKDNLALGCGIGFTSVINWAGSTTTSNTYFGINPYARWFFWKQKGIAPYLQGDIVYTTNNNYFSLGVLPGVAYSFNEHFSMNASIGFLGIRNDDANGFRTGFNIDATALRFGLAYTF